MAVVRLHRLVERRGPAEAPRGDAERGLVLPAFGLVHRLEAIGWLSRLEKETLGPDAIVERRDKDAISLGTPHDHERRCEPPRGVGAEQIAAAERIAEQHLAVPRIEWLVPRRRDLPARKPADHAGDGLDRLIPLRRHVPLD